MKIKKFSLLILCFISISNFAQTDLNQYKYLIVPKKFDFLKEANQYRLNELAVFLFEKYGFIAFMEGEDYPEDLSLNRCLALRSEILKDSGLFKTKLNIELKDCNDRVVYTSPEGESRKKEYVDAYNEAMRNTFSFLEAVNYKYAPSKAIDVSTTNTTKSKDQKVSKEIAQLKAEIETLKKEKQVIVEAEEVTVVEEFQSENSNENIVVKKPVESKNSTPQVAMTNKDNIGSVLYAQAIDNGFQLVDSTPKVVHKLKNSSLKDIFFVDGKQAIVYKKGDVWIMEYYIGDDLKLETLLIKF